MRENLLGYLLGALDASEQRAVERQLSDNPELRQQLEELRCQLEPLEETRDEYEPPFALADRTCDAVAHFDVPPVSPARQPLHRSSKRVDVPAGHGWTWADAVVAMGSLLACTLLFFPAIAKSRYDAQVVACQNNLRQLSFALYGYTELQPDRRYPAIPVEGNESFAGNVAVTLQASGLLPNTYVLICPASPMADRTDRFRVPTRRELTEATRGALVELQRVAGGSYGFNIGYVVSGRYMPARNEMRPQFAIAADASSPALDNRASLHHSGRGQNVLFDNGQVTFITGFPGESYLDDPFRNRQGRVEAGLDPDDAVVAPSDVRPLGQSGAW